MIDAVRQVQGNATAGAALRERTPDFQSLGSQRKESLGCGGKNSGRICAGGVVVHLL
ncbi:MAG: hypothetical protein GDA56_09565 [Hormoscilla sp. GM7CHS1pb]|nr:hypothetical protein [Hormoscilla sp. GM7CHS1pb]